MCTTNILQTITTVANTRHNTDATDVIIGTYSACSYTTTVVTMTTANNTAATMFMCRGERVGLPPPRSSNVPKYIPVVSPPSPRPPPSSRERWGSEYVSLLDLLTFYLTEVCVSLNLWPQP